MQAPVDLLAPSSSFPIVLGGLLYVCILAAPVVVLVLAVRFLRAYERRTQAIAGERTGRESIDALESQIERMRAELDRMREGRTAPT